jgi:phosphonate metabolism-associated iron-containing alcohol dehydrogenase
VTQSYFNPVRSFFGAGSFSRLSELVGERDAVLITFPEARELGFVARAHEMLQGKLVGEIDTVQPNPDVAALGPAYNAFWREHRGTDVIVALGGGSVIDTAKTMMVGTRSASFDELLAAVKDGTLLQPERVKTLIAIPTTAGTGSEVTPWATIWDYGAQVKHSLHLEQTWPSAALIDPALMQSLPASVTLQSGLDALSHALESIWNVNANPISDTFAVAAAREVIATLPALMRDLGNLDLRGRVSLAALKAGMAFSNTKTALAHSISYEMTLRYGLAHGIACSFSLPMVLQRAIGRSADRDRVLVEALGPLDVSCQRLQAFLERLGVKTQFSDYGVDGNVADRMIAQALTGARGRNFIGADGAMPG